MPKTIYDFDLIQLVPAPEREDDFFVGFANIISQLAQKMAQPLRTLPFWAFIDELPEARLDEAAWEMNLDFYDSTADRASKAAMIKHALQIKALRGTKWSTEQLIQIYLGGGWIEEAHEYGGAPFTFRVFVTNPKILQEEYDRFEASVRYGKNARSYMDEVFYFWNTGDATLYIDYRTQDGFWSHLMTGMVPYPYWKGKTGESSLSIRSDSKTGGYRHLRCSESTYCGG